MNALTVALVLAFACVASGALVRFAHASPDAPAVDVYVDGLRVRLLFVFLLFFDTLLTSSGLPQPCLQRSHLLRSSPSCQVQRFCFRPRHYYSLRHSRPVRSNVALDFLKSNAFLVISM
jgi:hypothetical protein